MNSAWEYILLCGILLFKYFFCISFGKCFIAKDNDFKLILDK